MISEYGPLAPLIGKWSNNNQLIGQNQAPDPDRNIENTKFKQEIEFTPIGQIDNHEQILFALEYQNKAWEEGDDSNPFHQELGYWIWDPKALQILKWFTIPRGISLIAGGIVNSSETNIFELNSYLGSQTYGIISNIFLDHEFQTQHYYLKIEIKSPLEFSYYENSKIKIKGQDKIFDHIEINTLKKII